MKNNQTFLSIIIPCYNEEANLKRGVLDEVEDYLNDKDFNWEVIISDDGSSDNSKKLVKKLIKDKQDFRLLENKHGGKPWAVWKGIEDAQGDWILFTDMDQSTPISELDKLLPYMAQDYQVVIGSRGMKREGFSIIRKLGSGVFKALRSVLLLPGINDTQCGFKAMKHHVAMQIFPQLQFFQDIDKEVKGWRVSAFDIEMLFLARKNNYKIKEVPVIWEDRDAAAEGKQKSYVKESKQMAQEVLRVKLNDLQGKYEE